MRTARTCSCGMRTAARRGRPATSRAAPSRTPTRWSSARIASRSPAVDGTIATTLEIAVSAEDDAEVRRVSVSNLGARVREIELTSYAEIVLATPAADAAHPAFSKLFVQTEFVPEIGALLATRRRRSPGEPEVFAAHLAVVEGDRVGPIALRDRPRALPRPRADAPHGALRDRRTARSRARWAPCSIPIFSLRCRVQDPAGSHGARRVLDARRAVAQRGARPRRQAPGPGGVPARGHAGVDAGPGPAPPSRGRSGRGAPVPASRQPRALLGSGAAARLRGARAQRAGTLGALGARNLRRPADRPGPDRRSRGPRAAPAAAPRPRVLADEAACRSTS